MNYILYAIPFFFLLIGLELLVDRWRGLSTYRLADSINSLSAGVLSQISGLLTKGLGLLTYGLALQHVALFELSAQQAWVWVLAFVLFRLFDAIKPWPIRWFDQRVHGGFGIMLDDIIAAVFSLAVMGLVWMMVG